MESDFYSCFDIRMYIFLHLKFFSKYFVVSFLSYRYQLCFFIISLTFFSIFLFTFYEILEKYLLTEKTISVFLLFWLLLFNYQ